MIQDCAQVPCSFLARKFTLPILESLVYSRASWDEQVSILQHTVSTDDLVVQPGRAPAVAVPHLRKGDQAAVLLGLTMSPLESSSTSRVKHLYLSLPPDLCYSLKLVSQFYRVLMEPAATLIVTCRSQGCCRLSVAVYSLPVFAFIVQSVL